MGTGTALPPGVNSSRAIHSEPPTRVKTCTAVTTRRQNRKRAGVICQSWHTWRQSAIDKKWYEIVFDTEGLAGVKSPGVPERSDVHMFLSRAAGESPTPMIGCAGTW